MFVSFLLFCFYNATDALLSAGGTLKIYADSLKPNIPYKTILLSTRDTADFAVVEALEKYGLEKENPREFCIARVKTFTTPVKDFKPVLCLLAVAPPAAAGKSWLQRCV